MKLEEQGRQRTHHLLTFCQLSIEKLPVRQVKMTMCNMKSMSEEDNHTITQV